VRVRVRALDGLELGACHLLKIDVEGHEPQVLRGARETIARHRPAIYVENDRRAQQQEVIGLLADMGYRLYWHTPGLYDPSNFNGSAENVFPGLASLNMLCLPAERGDGVEGQTPIDPGNWRSPI
jgi:hypothetical protein